MTKYSGIYQSRWEDFVNERREKLVAQKKPEWEQGGKGLQEARGEGKDQRVFRDSGHQNLHVPCH